MGYQKNPACKAESGVVHNPAPRTERGKRKHAKRPEDKQKRAEKLWSGATFVK